MARQPNRGGSLLLFATIFALAGCYSGPSVNGSFSRTYTVSGPIRLELSNASGDADITEGAAGTVSIHAEVRASGFGFENPQKRLDDIVSDPPIEQRGDTIRIGKDFSRMRNVSITYKIQVPHDTEVGANVASGAQNIRGLRGPVKVRSASGSINVEKIDRDTQLFTASGSISAENIGGDVQVSSASGNVTIANIKGDARVHVVSGVVRISQPGGRVDGSTTSGEVEIQGAANDVTARSVSGRVYVQGNPGTQGYPVVCKSAFLPLRAFTCPQRQFLAKFAPMFPLSSKSRGNTRCGLAWAATADGWKSVPFPAKFASAAPSRLRSPRPRITAHRTRGS